MSTSSTYYPFLRLYDVETFTSVVQQYNGCTDIVARGIYDTRFDIIEL